MKTQFKYKKYLSKVLCFVFGCLSGIILTLALWRPLFYIEVPVVREIVKHGKIEKPAETKYIFKTIPYEVIKEIKPERAWFLHTFEDSIIYATIEAQTESVQNFQYTILKYPVVTYTEHKTITKKHSIFAGYYPLSTFHLGYSYRFLGLSVMYDYKDKTIRPGIFIKFDF